MTPEPTPQLLLVVLAGPNGAGKSTFYEHHLARSSLPFVNADVIAREHFGPEAAAKAREAARISDEVRTELVNQRRSFIFETVLSDPVGDKVAFFREARAAGYFLDVHFIGLASPLLSLSRVTDRVRAGGHDVPDEKLASRYPRTLENLVRLLDAADRLQIYDNSEATRPHCIVAMLERGILLAAADPLPSWLAPVPLASRRTPHTQPL